VHLYIGIGHHHIGLIGFEEITEATDWIRRSIERQAEKHAREKRCAAEDRPHAVNPFPAIRAHQGGTSNGLL
jgi:hypothetical protein